MRLFRGKKKVALVLGSGGARGMAHVGVIKELVKEGIKIDMIVGSSSGALVGGLYASWGKIGDLEKIVEEVTYKDVAEILVDPTWGGGLIKGKKTLEFLKKMFKGEKIEKMKITFAAVATDVNTALPVVFDTGDAAEAVRASISVPLVYSPVEMNGRLLVDGGVSCPVPVEVAKQMGAEVVIAVNLDSVYFSGKEKKDTSVSSTVEILKDSYFGLRYNLAKKEVREADVVIEPEMRYIMDFDFVGGKKAVAAGAEATRKVMDKIKKLV